MNIETGALTDEMPNKTIKGFHNDKTPRFDYTLTDEGINCGTNF